MPLFKTITVPDGLLSVWQITEPSGELRSFFSPEETADPAFQKFTYEKRTTEWLVTRILLKQMLDSPFQVSYTASGKPLLSHPLYSYLSISHSRDFVAVLIHRQLAVGIDIESINRNYAPICKRYLSDTELEDVNQSPLLQCLYWCAKEAIFKLVEEDGVDFRQQIQITAFDPTNQLFSARFICGNKQRTYQLQHDTFQEHCMVWVCSNQVV